MPAQRGTAVALNQHSEYWKLRRVVCAVWYVQIPGKLYCSVVWSACFRNFTLSLLFSSARLSCVILPLTDSVQSQKLCFEKALVMSGWDHVVIHLFSARQLTVPPPSFHVFLSLTLSLSFSLSCSLLQGCIASVEKWLLDNCGVILGMCIGVAVVEVQYLSLPHNSRKGLSSDFCRDYPDTVLTCHMHQLGHCSSRPNWSWIYSCLTQLHRKRWRTKSQVTIQKLHSYWSELKEQFTILENGELFLLAFLMRVRLEDWCHSQLPYLCT